MYALKLWCALFIIFHAIAQEKQVLARRHSPETLAVLMDCLNVSTSAEHTSNELTLLVQSMNLRTTQHLNAKSKFEKIADLAIKLNACLIKDEGHYREIESLAMEFFPKKEPACDATSKVELTQLTRDALKNIVRLSKTSPTHLSLLEHAIHQIPAFNLKYMLNTQGFPVVIEEQTTKYKQDMLELLQN